MYKGWKWRGPSRDHLAQARELLRYSGPAVNATRTASRLSRRTQPDEEAT